MSGFWKGQRVQIKVEQQRQYKTGEFHWHTLYAVPRTLDNDVLDDIFNDHDMAKHRVTITPIKDEDDDA